MVRRRTSFKTFADKLSERCVVKLLFFVPAGVRMVYPSCLVLLPLTDIPAVVPQGAANTSGSMCGAQQGQTAHRDPAISSITLTPPTSPEEAQAGKI